MGTFYVKFTIRNPADPARALDLEGLVDTGAHFTQVPKTLLDQIGLIPFGIRKVQYANGPIASKSVASAEILIEQEVTPTVVICGDAHDLFLIGAFTMEGLNLGVDPVHKRLIPLIAPQA